MMKQIIGLDPIHYQRHRIHGESAIWAETNCYVDVWIELLHGWGFEPIAALPFTLAIDFEGDQWTFFKFPLRDLYRLYGLDVQELAIWRPLVDHIEEQVAMGRPVLVELDSFFLPDTAGTAYRRDHVKSTVAVNAIDIPGQRLGYFHNQAYYQLDGDDFVAVFRIQDSHDRSQLPPYAEFVKRRQPVVLTDGDLARISLLLLREQLAMLPVVNPFEKFKDRFTIDLDWLTTQSLDMFHRYSFATLRQFGACYELSATYLNWLQKDLQLYLHEAIGLFTTLATDAKTLQFELARAMMRKKRLDLSAIDRMAEQWQSAMDSVKACIR